MSAFPDFIDYYGSGYDCQPVAPNLLEKYRKIFPEPLLLFWEKSGFCFYGDGLIQIINPDEFQGMVNDWIISNTPLFSFLRTAFGLLFVWDGKAVYQIDTLYHQYSEAARDMELFLNQA